MINFKSTTFLVLLVLAGCQITPTERPKTREEVKAESAASSRQQTIDRLKAEGKTQQEIDNLLAYIDLPYKKKIESKIENYNTPAGNMLALLNFSYSTCKQKQNFYKILMADGGMPTIMGPSGGNDDLTRETKADLAECSLASTSVVNNFYYSSYYKKPFPPKEYELVNEAYIKWSSYMDEVVMNPNSNLVNQLSAETSQFIQRANISVDTRKPGI